MSQSDNTVAGQTHGDVEHILIDGASTDGTLELLQARRAGLAQLVSEPDGGIYFGLNKGIALARGEVLGFLHGDDVYADAQVLAQVAEAFADPAVAAVYGDLEYVSQADPTRVVRHWRAGAYQPRQLRWRGPLCQNRNCRRIRRFFCAARSMSASGCSIRVIASRRTMI